MSELKRVDGTSVVAARGVPDAAACIDRLRALIADYHGNALGAQAYAGVAKAMALARDFEAASASLRMAQSLDCSELGALRSVGMVAVACAESQERSFLRGLLAANSRQRLEESTRLLVLLRDSVRTGSLRDGELAARAVSIRAAAYEAERDGDSAIARDVAEVLRDLDGLVGGESLKKLSLVKHCRRSPKRRQERKSDDEPVSGVAATPRSPKTGSRPKRSKSEKSGPSKSSRGGAPPPRRARRRSWPYLPKPEEAFDTALRDGKLLLLHVPLDASMDIERVEGDVENYHFVAHNALLRNNVIESALEDASDRRVASRRLRQIVSTIHVHFVGMGRSSSEIVGHEFFNESRGSYWIIIQLAAGVAWTGTVDGKSDLAIKKEVIATVSTVLSVSTAAPAVTKAKPQAVVKSGPHSPSHTRSQSKLSTSVSSAPRDHHERLTMSEIVAIEALVASKSFGLALDGLQKLKSRRGSGLSRLPTDWQARLESIEGEVEFLAKRRAKSASNGAADASLGCMMLIGLITVVLVLRGCIR